MKHDDSLALSHSRIRCQWQQPGVVQRAQQLLERWRTIYVKLGMNLPHSAGQPNELAGGIGHDFSQGLQAAGDQADTAGTANVSLILSGLHPLFRNHSS